MHVYIRTYLHVHTYVMYRHNRLSCACVIGMLRMHFTFQLMKIGFDEETSQMDMKRLISQLADLRSPTKVTLGLKLHQAPGTELDMSLSGPPSGIKSSVVEASTKLKNFHMLEQMQQASGAAALPIVKKGTLTRVKVMSDLSRSPYGREMRRLGVASLNVAATASASTAAVWRMSIVNSVYAMCSRYSMYCMHSLQAAWLSCMHVHT